MSLFAAINATIEYFDTSRRSLQIIPSHIIVQIIQGRGINDLFYLSDLCDLALVTAWELHNLLDLGQLSVTYRSCATPYNGRLRTICLMLMVWTI